MFTWWHDLRRTRNNELVPCGDADGIKFPICPCRLIISPLRSLHRCKLALLLRPLGQLIPPDPFRRDSRLDSSVTGLWKHEKAHPRVSSYLTFRRQRQSSHYSIPFWRASGTVRMRRPRMRVGERFGCALHVGIYQYLRNWRRRQKSVHVSPSSALCISCRFIGLHWGGSS